MLPEGASQYVRGKYQIQKVKKQLQKANARTNESVPVLGGYKQIWNIISKMINMSKKKVFR